jgi:hypothetical protein
MTENIENYITQLFFYTWCQVKIKLSMRLTKHHSVKAYGGVELQFNVLSTSEPDEGKWSASRPGRFGPGERTPGTRLLSVLQILYAMMGYASSTCKGDTICFGNVLFKNLIH